MRYRREHSVKTWEDMKEKLMFKYLPPSFSQQLLDKQNRLTQKNKSATDYIAKFDEYLNQYGAIELESIEQTISRFRSGLMDDYRRELIARGITTLEQAYQLVIHLDESRGSYFHQNNFRDNSKTTITSKSSFSRFFSSLSKSTSSSSSVKPAGSSSAKLTTSERRAVSEPAKVNLRTQCYRCQGYGHIANQWLSQTKTLLVEVPIEDIEEGDDVEVIVHQQNDESDASVEECKFNSCIRTAKVMNLTPSQTEPD